MNTIRPILSYTSIQKYNNQKITFKSYPKTVEEIEKEEEKGSAIATIIGTMTLILSSLCFMAPSESNKEYKQPQSDIFDNTKSVTYDCENKREHIYLIEKNINTFQNILENNNIKKDTFLIKDMTGDNKPDLVLFKKDDSNIVIDLEQIYKTSKNK